jgi:hypothetical protein
MQSQVPTVLRFSFRIQTSLLFVAPSQVGPLHILPDSTVITRLLKIPDMVRILECELVRGTARRYSSYLLFAAFSLAPPATPHRPVRSCPFIFCGLRVAYFLAFPALSS